MAWQKNALGFLLILSAQFSFGSCLLDYLLCKKLRTSRPKVVAGMAIKRSEKAIEMTVLHIPKAIILNPLDETYASAYSVTITQDRGDIKSQIIFQSGKRASPTGSQAVAMIEGLRAKDQILSEELIICAGSPPFLTVYTTI